MSTTHKSLDMNTAVSSFTATIKDVMKLVVLQNVGEDVTVVEE